MAEPIDQKTPFPDAHAGSAAPLGGTRQQNVQRLQVGIAGIAAMILLVGLASIVIDQARLTEESVVTAQGGPAAVPVEEAPAGPSDPLADIGVVPDLPAETPTPETTGTAAPANPDSATPPRGTANEN